MPLQGLNFWPSFAISSPTCPLQYVVEVPPQTTTAKMTIQLWSPLLLIWESFLTHGSTLINPLDMRTERSRLLSNLTAHSSTTSSRMCLIHAPNEPYMPMAQYTASLPIGGSISPRPVNEDSEDEGETIQHWHQNAIEIDPLPEYAAECVLDLSGADVDAPDEPLKPSRSRISPPRTLMPSTLMKSSGPSAIAIAAELKQICGTINGHIDSFTAARNASELDGSLIDAFLCMLTHLSREPSVIVRTALYYGYHAARATRPDFAPADFTYGDACYSSLRDRSVRKHSANRRLATDSPTTCSGVSSKASARSSTSTLSARLPATRIRASTAMINTLLPHGHIKCRR